MKLHGKNYLEIQEYLTDWAIANLDELPTTEQIDIEKTYYAMMRWLIKCGEPGRMIPGVYRKGQHDPTPPTYSTKYCDTPLAVELSKLEPLDWWICTEYLKAIAPRTQKEAVAQTLEQLKVIGGKK